MRHTSTYTVVKLPVSKTAYAEIAGKLRDAGYDHVFSEDDGEEMIDMTHIALVVDENEVETVSPSASPSD